MATGRRGHNAASQARDGRCRFASSSPVPRAAHRGIPSSSGYARRGTPSSPVKARRGILSSPAEGRRGTPSSRGSHSQKRLTLCSPGCGHRIIRTSPESTLALNNSGKGALVAVPSPKRAPGAGKRSRVKSDGVDPRQVGAWHHQHRMQQETNKALCSRKDAIRWHQA
ncbi:hypothetical protein ACP70R_007663 [Stipagrostis hirtigluma subsp. patula]